MGGNDESPRAGPGSRVPGVFYRASTRRVAQEAGVTGYVRNLHIGRTVGIVLRRTGL